MNSKIISIKMNSKIVSIKMNSVLRALNRFRDGANAKTILDCTASRFFFIALHDEPLTSFRIRNSVATVNDFAFLGVVISLLISM